MKEEKNRLRRKKQKAKDKIAPKTCTKVISLCWAPNKAAFQSLPGGCGGEW